MSEIKERLLRPAFCQEIHDEAVMIRSGENDETFETKEALLQVEIAMLKLQISLLKNKIQS